MGHKVAHWSRQGLFFFLLSTKATDPPPHHPTHACSHTTTPSLRTPALPSPLPPASLFSSQQARSRWCLCFCLAHGDRQPLPANSLPGNQLTGLDSARCCCNSSSPTVGGGGGGAAAAAAAAAADATERWNTSGRQSALSPGCSRLRGGEISPRTASCVSVIGYTSGDTPLMRAEAPLQDRIPPCLAPPRYLLSLPDASIWIKELRARGERTRMPR